MSFKLTDYEKEMLNGKHGEAKQLAMKILLEVGESLGAEEMVEVVSVQAMAHFGSLHIAGRDWLEKLACMGGECAVPTTQDPASIPFKHWEEMGYDEEYAKNQYRLRDAIIELGEYPAWSCTPYQQGYNIPRIGQNVAWAESSAVIYGNSVLGAKTDRTPAGLSICAAITGRMPKFGLYIDENRKAEVKVKIDAGELSDLDYNTIGIIMGKTVGNYIPAIYGIPNKVTNDNLKYMGASAAASGSVALFHAYGITPEAFYEDPFKNIEPIEEILITRKDIEKAEKELCTDNPGEVDLVVTGCPHCSAEEIVKISKLMKGKKVQDNKDFWIFTTLEIENLMDRMGIGKQLKDAGIRIMAQTCLVISPLVGDYKTLMTNSGKKASYLPSEHDVELIYGSIEDCVNAVTE